MTIPLFVKSCWHLLKIAAVAMVILAGAAVAYLYLGADNHIRHFVEKRLSEHYTSHQVQIQSARRVSARQIILRGLRITKKGVPKRAKPVLSVDEVLIRCNTGVDDLVQLRFNLAHITLRGLSLNLEHRHNGAFNLHELFPLPTLGNNALLTVIEGGHITYVDRRRSAENPIELNNVSLSLQFPDRSISLPAATSQVKFHGSARGTQSQRLQFVGQFDKQTRAWTTTGRLEGLFVASDLERSVPLTWNKTLKQFGSFRSQANLQFQLSSAPPKDTNLVGTPQSLPTAHTMSPVCFEVDGKLSDGHLTDDARLPFPLTEISADIHFDNNQLSVNDVEAHCGRTTLNASLHCEGYGLHHPFTLQATANNVHIVEYTSVLESLPLSIRKHWGQFSPAGEISFELDLTSDGKTLSPDVSITCHNLEFTTPSINYRLHHGQGTISLHDHILDVDLVAQASGQAMRIGGQIHQPGAEGWGHLELSSIDPIPINRTLLESVTPKAHDILAAFHPMGSFRIQHARFERADPTQPWNHDLLISLERCFIQHDMFPYPLSNVRGMLRMQNNEWTFYDLEGQNDSGHVVGQGRWQQTATGGLLILNFAGTQIALEDELRNSLSAKARKIWTQLRPRGTLDSVQVNISRHTGKPASLQVVLDQHYSEPAIDERSISIHPTWFPYPMNHVTGQLIYDGTQLTFHQLRASHGPVEIITGGQCHWDKSGSWKFQLNDLSVDRLVLDRELAAAFPDRLRRAVVKLDPQGPVNLTGTVSFQGGQNLPTSSEWNIILNTAGGTLNPGIHLDHIFGGIRFVGSYDGEHFHSQGELNIASLLYRDIQFTSIKGPIRIDDSQLFLGSWSGHTRQPKLPPHLEAKVFGGTLYADGQVPFNTQQRFEINASLAGGSLSQASLLSGAQQDISGKAFGFVKLTGAGTGLHTLDGSGTVNLHEADIYELPFMVALLKLVKIRSPDRIGFTESDTRFHISGEHIYFDPIKFKGDAISLVGKGDLDFAGDLDIDFYAMVGGDRLKLPLVTPILGEASRQFMLIHVGGPFNNPQMTRQPFPGLNDTIQQIFPEAARRQEERTTRLGRLRRTRLRDRITQ